MINSLPTVGTAACFVLLLSSTPAGSQTDHDSLLARLQERPLSFWVMHRLEEQPAVARTTTALRAAFEECESKEDRRLAAATLLRIGETSDRYFEFLAGYAIQAVEDRSPSCLRYDQNGQFVRGQLSAEFENWCEQNEKVPGEMAALQLRIYPDDLMALASVEDPRALSIFRRGLKSNNPLVIAYSVRGLARLQDTSAIPLISKVADGFRPEDRGVIAMQLPWYRHPWADHLFDRLVTSPAERDYRRRNVLIEQVDELKTMQRRKAAIGSK